MPEFGHVIEKQNLYKMSPKKQLQVPAFITPLYRGYWPEFPMYNSIYI